jgi:hypothetical protein
LGWLRENQRAGQTDGVVAQWAVTTRILLAASIKSRLDMSLVTAGDHLSREAVAETRRIMSPAGAVVQQPLPELPHLSNPLMSA